MKGIKPTRHFTSHLFFFIFRVSAAVSAASHLLTGFEATPDTTPTTTFQSVLVDPTSTFSLCFLRLEPDNQLSLAVVHLPSRQPLWTAPLTRPARWDKQTRFTFNGSIVISDPHSGAIWSTRTDNGQRLALSSSSNLQIFGSGSGSGPPLWQSFDYPSDTLVEGQNLTSAMTLVSSNNLYTLRLGADFIGLYANFNTNMDQMYYKHSALQARANLKEDEGPIYIRVSPDGYLGMYQNLSKPADFLPFNSYLRPVPSIRRIRIEPDGNLKSYYWSGSDWVVDYQAISETCELPSPCGPYGLCRAGVGCNCLLNKTKARPGECYSGQASGDFCGRVDEEFTVSRRAGVELPYKSLMGYTETASLERCEMACESNCTCWGALYTNASGRCYLLDYPVQTLVSVGDLSKVGYFKVREGARSGKLVRVGLGVG